MNAPDPLTPSEHAYEEDARAAVYRVIAERRDMRHFRPGAVDPAVLRRLLWAAHHAPSVGYMQPWRFVRVTDAALRDGIYALVEEERIATARALGEREEAFMRLKVEGIRECGELLVVALCADRERHVFGRRTLPEMDLASCACAIQNMWLAALVGMPEGARPVAVLCIGHVEAFYPAPMLELEGWASRLPEDVLIGENRWPESGT